MVKMVNGKNDFQSAELFEMNGNVNGEAARKNSLAIIINGANLTQTQSNVVKVAPANNNDRRASSSVVIKDVTPPTPVFVP